MTERDQTEITPPSGLVQPRGSERFRPEIHSLKQLGTYSLNLCLSEVQNHIRRLQQVFPYALGGLTITTAAYMLTPEGTPYREEIPAIGVVLTVATMIGYMAYNAYRRSRRNTAS